MDYEILRKRMVEEQLIGRGIRDKKVLEAFGKVERHKFVPEDLRMNAYADFPIPLDEGQTISQPYIVALMTECLNLSPKDKILEIGTGSGYQTAILAELAGEVYSVERFEALAEKARTLLNSLGYKNIKIKAGDGTLGWKEEAPFDKIIVTASSPKIPPPLTEELGENGKLILPLGENFSQTLTLVEKKEGKLQPLNICGCVFVPLIGKYGWGQKHA
ncbi:MAG: protein-L-isoaspartate(D-aspartate) O-methyltransferase [Candidatus Omnitrophica bacterium]|nr:protein-L-isoaspartate(D-aspartate) O-methyltransferase [Candidatus Omnitrophota bacterium]MDD5591753.1 protein-L-isoaspartate(D-aspartate) O-methyltransferase [Candidatus Omnitrophota bacterium]